MPEFVFDKRVQRYRYASGPGKGQFVGRKAMQNLRGKLIEDIKRDTEKIANLLKEEKITIATWERETLLALKTLHVQQFLLGRGGRYNLAEGDLVKLSERTRGEATFLRGFAEAMQRGELSEAQFDARLGLYLASSRGSFENGRGLSHRDSGYLWERRIRTKVESCAECLAYAARGWQPLGTLPNPTELCTCRANCGCFKEYSKDLKKPKDAKWLLSCDGWLP